MRILLIILSLFVSTLIRGQSPTGVPNTKTNGWIEHKFIQGDSGVIGPNLDTTAYAPRFPFTIVGRRLSSDTSLFYWSGTKWKKLSSINNNDFIQNQQASDQTANYRITGQGRMSNALVPGEFSGGGDDGFFSVRVAKSGALSQRFKRAFQDYSSVLPSSTNLGYISFEAFGRVEGAGAVAQGYIAAFVGRPTFDVTGGATLQKMYGVYVGALSKNGTTDTVFGFYNAEINNPAFTGVTPVVNNSYAFYSEPMSKATKNWGIYINGSQTNYFGGSVGILTTTPTAKLHVAGTGLFTDTVTITTIGTPDSSNRAASTAWVKRQGFGTSGGTVASVSGTANRITSSGGTTPVIDIAATYVGQSSITTLGTIGTGNWNGTAIGITFGGAPSAGTTGQVLTKNTNTNYDYSWTTPAATGITTLNTLTAATQTFAVGTSGTDFAISSATSTHTFNLPTASATNRGALSTTDWSAFNAKIGAADTAAIASRAWRTNGNNMGGVTGLFGTTSNDNISIITNNTVKGFISAGGTFVWAGVSATAGFKMDIHGRTLIFTSPTGQNEFLVDDDGVNGQNATVVMNPSGSNNKVLLLTALNDNIITGRVYGSSTDGFAIGGRNGSATVGYFGINNSVAITATSGTFYTATATNSFAPTSGTAEHNVFEDGRTINQTGGASGATRGLYIHPTLTAAASYTAIQNTVGNNSFNSTSGNSNFGGTLSYSITTTSSGTVTVGSTIVYSFTGTTSTFTMPAVSGTAGKVYIIKSRGSGNITLSSNSGSEIYDTAAQTSITILPGQSITLISDGTYWLAN